MWRDTGRPVRVVFLDARACLAAARLCRLLELGDLLYRGDRRDCLLGDQLGRAHGSFDAQNDPTRLRRPLSACGPGLEAPEVRMRATESAPLKTLDVAYVSQVVRALLNEAVRQTLVEDGLRRDLVPI